MAQGLLADLQNPTSIAEQVGLPYGISLAGTTSQPQNKS